MTSTATYIPTTARPCPHTSPEVVVLHSPKGRFWLVVRCGICGETLS